MEKKIKSMKDYVVDLIVCLTTAAIVIAVFGFYFYNVFIKFQVNYAHLFNDSILSKSTELHNDVITVSNSLFTNSDVNAFFNSQNDTLDINSTEYIEGCIRKSTINGYISHVVISIPKNNSIYSTDLKRKVSYESYKEYFPQFEKIIKNHKGTMCITPVDQYVVYSYKHYNGDLILTIMWNDAFKSKVTEHVYPIFYGTVLLNGDGNPIVSNIGKEYEKISDTVRKMDLETLKVKNNYFIIKDSTSLYSSVSIIRLTDMLSTAVNSGSFLLVVLLLVCMFIFIIMYYFYFRHKKLISDNHVLKIDHLDVSINNIIQKIFSHDILTAQNEVSLNEYFSLNNGVCFVPILVGIENYKTITKDTGYDDLSMYKYGFENIISEVLSELAGVKTINMGEELIGVLLYHKESVDFSVLKEKILYIGDIIKKNFGMGLFFVVGDETDEIISAYEQIPILKNAQSYRFIKDDNEIVLSEITQKNTETKYPVLIQSEIIANITTGNISAFRSSLNKFSEYITKNEYQNGKEWFLKLFLAISESCKNSPNISIKYNALESMLECDKISEITAMLMDSIEYTTISEENETEETEEDFAKSVTKIIEKEFSNPDFCIQSITNHFGITASYFGKKFKRHFDTSFNHYLLERRLNHAIKLLKETDYTNEKIAFLCGFNSRTYFLTIFKKTLGMSPKDFKNKPE